MVDCPHGHRYSVEAMVQERVAELEPNAAAAYYWAAVPGVRGGVPAVSLCASCGLQLSGDAGLCPHHHCVYGDDWAVANRIMCDFFHRKKVPPRLPQTERDDDFWARTGETA